MSNEDGLEILEEPRFQQDAEAQLRAQEQGWSWSQALEKGVSYAAGLQTLQQVHKHCKRLCDVLGFDLVQFKIDFA